jgi:hypothetical protein
MTNRLRRFVFLLVISSFACTIHAAEAVSVDIRLLAENAEHLVGQRIVVHGCLVMSPHAQFIEACGNKDWRASTLVWDPKELSISAIGKLRTFSTNIEGDFSGVVISRVVDWPQPGARRPFLELQSVANLTPYEP